MRLAKPHFSNNLQTFWKFPRNLPLTYLVRHGWAAVGCRVPPELENRGIEHKKLHSVAGQRIYARVANQNPGPGWRELLVSDAGQCLLWADCSRSRYLIPFDPEEVIEDTLSEQYLEKDPRAALQQVLHRCYYRIRPLVPRTVQMWMKRGYSAVQAPNGKFPSWPVETSVDWVQHLAAWAFARACGDAIPHLAFWPEAKRFCAVITHDVETAVGVSNIPRLLDIERRVGIRSCWNFVPERYEFDPQIIARLQSEGFEVGVHGLNHDGRLFESHAMFVRRAGRIRDYAHQWGASGFRSPACHRRYEWMKSGLLDFAYDSSYPDTDPYQPMPGGCCTVFPWFLGGMVELPITLPQDHVVFDIRGESAQIWREKLEYIESVGGLAVLIVHPDYMVEEARLRQYEGFLLHLRSRPASWLALPKDVAAWWTFRSSADLDLNRDGFPTITAQDTTQFTANSLTVSRLQAATIPGQFERSPAAPPDRPHTQVLEREQKCTQHTL